jgi:hypothetical protein
VQPIHILLYSMPRLLHELIRESLDGEEDLAFAGVYASADDLGPALERLRGERYVLIGGTNGPDTGKLRELLGRHPQAKLLALAQDGRETFLYELRPHRQPLGSLSPETLVAAVRAAPSAALYDEAAP